MKRTKCLKQKCIYIVEMPGRSSSSGRSYSSSRSSSFASRNSTRPSYSYSSPKSPVSAPTPSYTPAPSTVNHNHQLQQPGFFLKYVARIWIRSWSEYCNEYLSGQTLRSHTFTKTPRLRLPQLPVVQYHQVPKHFIQRNLLNV